MIFVECYADQVLVQAVRNIRVADIAHELKGKGTICSRLQNKAGCTALLDEDPSSPQPPYLKELTLHQNLQTHDIKEFRDISRANIVVVLTPKLEDWILRACRISNVRLDAYSLPSTPSELHRVINYRLDKFNLMVGDLLATRSPMLTALASVL